MRLSRKDYAASFFHVMVQGHNKEYIFEKDKNKKKYLELMKENEKELEILAYCIMGNHVHMLLHTSVIENMSKFMHKINSEYAMYYNYIEKYRVGSVYRDRYKSEPIYDERYFFKCINYIHRNPVKANIVPICEKYEYSSYNDYINKIGCAEKEVLKKVFNNENYIEVLNMYNKNINLFIDTEKENKIDDAINDYLEINNKKMIQILENENDLRNLIMHIKNITNSTYDEIQKKFNISRNRIANILK